jgi:acetyl esterase/lipase
VPSLLLVPEDDDLVDPQRNTFALAEKLRGANKRVAVNQLAGTSHTTIIGTMSPILFFKEGSVQPVVDFVRDLSD